MQASAAPRAKFCPSCVAATKMASKFCTSCGAALTRSEPTQNAAPVTPALPTANVGTPFMAGGIATSRPGRRAGKPPSTLLFKGIAFGALVLVIVAAFLLKQRAETAVSGPSAPLASLTTQESPQPNSAAVFNQICPTALANAQATSFVPYVAKLVTLNAQPISRDHYACSAEGRGITYTITMRVSCDDLVQAHCAEVTKVVTDSGKVLWQGLD